MTDKEKLNHCCKDVCSGWQDGYSERQEIVKKQLEKIQGMCGHPDAGQACRNIIEYISEIIPLN